MTPWDCAKGRALYDALAVGCVVAGLIAFVAIGFAVTAIQGWRRRRNRRRP